MGEGEATVAVAKGEVGRVDVAMEVGVIQAAVTAVAARAEAEGGGGARGAGRAWPILAISLSSLPLRAESTDPSRWRRPR